MPQPRAMPFPRFVLLAGRLLLAAALIAGLLGMHVLMSPGTHSAHAPTFDVAVAGASDPSPLGAEHADAAHAAADDAVPPCRSSGCADTSSPAPDSVWAVVCVLALLLTALVAVRPLGLRRLVRRAGDPTAITPRLTVDDGPRHPPSLIELSISRT